MIIRIKIWEYTMNEKLLSTKTPRIVLTDERWSSEPVVVFNTDLDIDLIPDDWVNDRLQCNEDTQTRKEIIEDLVDELHEDNMAVDEYWLDDKICRCGKEYYRYDDEGNAQFIDEYNNELRRKHG